MRYASILDRLSGLGSDKWEIHFRARARIAAGEDVIALTIGEPDIPTPAELIETSIAALHAGRTGYSNGAGEPGLRRALAARYSASTGRAILPDQVLCLPGTQTALYAVMMGLTEAGDEVIAGDPMYATYEGVIRASGARAVPVPLRPERGFRLSAEDVAAHVTPATRVILLNTPHNPTGAVMSADDIAGIGALARAHDLWIVCDEVYEELVFDGTAFASPLARADLAERTIVVASISKSHAAPGFRSGWAIGPADWAARQLALDDEGVPRGEQVTPYQIDLRYAGQGMRLTVNLGPEEFAAQGLAELGRRFDAMHEQLFTFSLDAQRELYNLRAVVQGRETMARASELPRGNGDPAAAVSERTTIFFEGRDHPAQIYDRALLKAGDRITGPAIVTEMDSTSLILPGHVGEVDPFGNILINPA